ncbi:unnamed protein product [Lymnaea stagnalis]|uniref:G-protein coupled receptors family 1 profile domain-containing protein n=1 Tax=Lymnaea stagnalis TaxID=6523 RepID=A0AAV2IFH5_LYMST
MGVPEDEGIARFATAALVSSIVCFALGLIVNLVVLVSIVTSPAMRFHLRNKLIANMCACHLTEIAFRIPIGVYLEFKNPKIHRECYMYSAIVNLELIQVFIVNWNLVFLISVLIEHIRDVNPAVTWSKMHRTLACILLMALPWAAAMIIVPLLLNTYSTSHHVAGRLPDGCILPTHSFLAPVTAVVSLLPHLTSVVLTAAAIVMSRRSSRESLHPDEAGTHTRSGVGPLPVYITAVTLTIVCDVPMVLAGLRIYDDKNSSFRTKALYLSGIISNLSIIINPLPWLLLPDVRHRIKTCMPFSHRRRDANGTMALKGIRSCDHDSGVAIG